MDLLTELAILVLAAFVGFEVISKVPNTLHTPLMSGTNAIHGIVLLGGLLVIGPADGFLEDVLVVIAIAFGTINVVGGFLVTDRMLGMFKSKPRRRRAGGVSRADLITLLYIVAFAMFIVGLHMLRGPRTAVRGNQVAAVGMAIAVVATLIDQRIDDWGLIVDRARHRHRDRRPQRALGAHDRDAADGRAVQRRRRRRRGADLARRVPRGARGGRQPAARGADPDPVRRDHRLDLVLGLASSPSSSCRRRSRAASRSRARSPPGSPR